MALVGIALGSNLGRKVSHISAARDLLAKLQPRNATLIQAPLYQSVPVDCPEGAPDFYNTAIEMVFDGSPQQLLQKTQEIETSLGRSSKKVENEARIIDVDILYFDDLILDTTELQLPHPRLHLRRFVLEPLSEVCPDRILPNQSMTVAELLENLISEEPPLFMERASW